ncbi:MAG: hypothetical protein OEW82_06720 [Dehalococcoidia bacterium]|nr:hypothetical protein [Dehalococcoidia bacterium]
MAEEGWKREEQEKEAVGKFCEKHPGWQLLQVAKCPVPGCRKPLYCEEHQYAYRKWWINLSVGLKR